MASDCCPAEEARALRAFLFDLDDTLLDNGAAREAAYSALFRLSESGLVARRGDGSTRGVG